MNNPPEDAFISLVRDMIFNGDIEIDLNTIGDDRNRTAYLFCRWSAKHDPDPTKSQRWSQWASHLNGVTGESQLLHQVETEMDQFFSALA